MSFNALQSIDDLIAKRRSLAEELRFVDSAITAYNRSPRKRENDPAASPEKIAS